MRAVFYPYFLLIFYPFLFITPLSTLYNSLILKGLKFNSFLAKNCKPSIYRALEKRVESQVFIIFLYHCLFTIIALL